MNIRGARFSFVKQLLPPLRAQQPLRLAFGKPPSRAVEPALGQEISPQWEIPKFASGQSPTGALPRKHLLTLTQGRLNQGDSLSRLGRHLPQRGRQEDDVLRR